MMKVIIVYFLCLFCLLNFDYLLCKLCKLGDSSDDGDNDDDNDDDDDDNIDDDRETEQVLTLRSCVTSQS